MTKVVRGYSAAYADPIKICAGDVLSPFVRPCEWPGWVWCRAADGKEGWVPISHIRKNGADYTAICDYDARELSVRKDETVELLRQESGWAWCQNSEGNEGWLPLACLDLSARS